MRLADQRDIFLRLQRLFFHAVLHIYNKTDDTFTQPITTPLLSSHTNRLSQIWTLKPTHPKQFFLANQKAPFSRVV